MKPGRKVGLILIVLGLIFGAVNAVMIVSAGKYLPKLTAAVPVLLLLGLAMMLFPGEAEGKEASEKISLLWKGAAMKDRAAWILSSAAGLAVGLYVVFRVL